MVFSHFALKQNLWNKFRKQFHESEAKTKDFGVLKAGYQRGFNDCLKWVIKRMNAKDLKDLKKKMNALYGEEEQ